MTDEMEPTPEKLLDHEYDGIKEYDNPLPRWWIGIFWITILFSCVYFIYYQFGPGPTVIDEYNQGMTELDDLQAKEILKLGPITDGTIVKLAKDAGMMTRAQSLFQNKCSPCHGMEGQGIIGPNLTDDRWIHGGRPTNIYTTISEGVPSKGMLTWKNQLRPVELLTVAAYVTTLQGTHPPNPKAPEGQQFVFDPATAANEPAPAAAPAATPKTPEKKADEGPGAVMKTVARPAPEAR